MSEARAETAALEAAVIGSALIDPEAVTPLVTEGLSAEDFSDPVARHLFEAIVRLFLNLKSVDAVTVLAEAGAEYEGTIREYMARTPTAASIKTYIQQLREAARLSEMRSIAMRIVDAGTLPDAETALSELQELALSRPRRRAATYTELVRDYLTRQGDQSQPDYLDWGLKEINAVAPIRRGRFVVLGADSSVGKTAFAMQTAYHMARTGKRVAFYSYETSLEDSADRILANAADIPLPRSKYKHLTPGDFARAFAEGTASMEIPLEVVETAGYTTGELRAEIVAHRIEVAFIDYVQLIPGDADNRWETVTRTSMELHTMAQQTGCTIVALSQVTLPGAEKGGVRKTIDKHSLRESRQLTNDADLILLLDLADPTFPDGPRVLKVAKNKDGRLGGMFLTFDAEHMRFSPGRPPMQTGSPIPSREEMDADNARREAARERRRPKGPPEEIEGQEAFRETEEATPFEARG